MAAGAAYGGVGARPSPREFGREPHWSSRPSREAMRGRGAILRSCRATLFG
ncbi:hypothetical protein BV133_702 [Blastochloris viridis]|uniref:Uncharacterized protein n=1 Tax=Blastochloris viridis TaxID=1079 RepID=A0A182CYJ2_BLAVI|nr:hypothetical protein BV133_702 [Blastochloris viridis]